LARQSFPYTRLPVNPTLAFPDRNTTPRPLIPLIISSGRAAVAGYAVIDSGADDCLLPASFASQLGFRLDEGSRYEFGGAGSAKQTAWFFAVTLAVAGFSPFPAYVGFTPALERTTVGILGQNGFFDRFVVEFDLRNSVFHIED